MGSFRDEDMARLYEQFVLAYYRYHWPELNAVSKNINWDTDLVDEGIQFLPTMKTDITLSYQGKTLIIDTKYYSRVLQLNHDSYRFHSGNLYQIFAYVKNYDTQRTGNVCGLLLYAKTGQSITPDTSFSMSGNRIGVTTLDLNGAFSEITNQLDAIVKSHFDLKH